MSLNLTKTLGLLSQPGSLSDILVSSIILVGLVPVLGAKKGQMDVFYKANYELLAQDLMYGLIKSTFK